MLEALIAEFETLDDPRCEWKVEHRLLDILVIAVCAVLGEAESFEDIALYGPGPTHEIRAIRRRCRERREGDETGRAYALRCLVPESGDTAQRQRARDELWARFSTAAPPRRRRCVARYSGAKRA
jgi:hypothetical protein